MRISRKQTKWRKARQTSDRWRKRVGYTFLDMNAVNMLGSCGFATTAVFVKLISQNPSARWFSDQGNSFVQKSLLVSIFKQHGKREEIQAKGSTCTSGAGAATGDFPSYCQRRPAHPGTLVFGRRRGVHCFGPGFPWAWFPRALKSEYTVVVNASEKSSPGRSSLHMSQMSSFLLSFQRHEAEAGHKMLASFLLSQSFLQLLAVCIVFRRQSYFLTELPTLPQVQESLRWLVITLCAYLTSFCCWSWQLLKRHAFTLVNISGLVFVVAHKVSILYIHYP